MPVAVRPDLSEENLRSLLAEGHESETLDYKQYCDVNVHDELLEIVKDVGAMQILGGYIVIGANDDGKLSGQVVQSHLRSFEQATLRSKFRKYLDEPLDVRCKNHKIGNDSYILIYIGPNPNGFAAFRITGQNSQNKIVFHQGAVYARHGSASEPWNASDMARIQQGMVSRQKEEWMREASNIFTAHLPSPTAIALAAAPIGALNWGLDGENFVNTATELIRKNDLVPIKLLLTGIGSDVGAMLTDSGGEEHVKTVLDRLTCLASLALRLDEQELFRSVLEGFVTVHGLPTDSLGNRRSGLTVEPTMLHFEIIQRIAAIGSVAERLRNWGAIRLLVLQKGNDLDSDYYPNWYREDLTMAARSNMFKEAGSSLLSFAQGQIERLDCLRFDLPPGDEDLLNSLCRFDFLACIVGIDDAGEPAGNAYFPSFANYWTSRIRPAAEALIEMPEMRAQLFHGSDEQLAEALKEISRTANSQAGMRGWTASMDSSKIREFLDKHPGN